MNKLFVLSKIGVLAALFAIVFSSCENSAIFDGEGDCEVQYRVKFKYDRNMKFADAFSSEVTSVALYAFNKDGILEYHSIESGEALASEEYSMPVDVQPGNYEILAWCGVGNGESFTVSHAEVGVTTKDEIVCQMNTRQENDVKVVSDDLKPLYHGKMSLVVGEEPGTYYQTMSLTKNTNVVRILLQQLSGKDVDADMLSFEIQDHNSVMAHDNSLIGDDLVVYKPWSITSGNADIDAGAYNTIASRSGTSVGVVVAEMTVGRLLENARPVLVVRNLQENKVVLSIPLVDYALLVKGNYNKAMSNQEYLDRQDEYSMTFFLDESGDWISSSIIVNSWRIVLNNETIN